MSARTSFSDKGHREEPLAESAAMNLVSYLLAGLLIFGVPGWFLDRWLGTTWIVGVGIVLGMAVALLTIWARYGTGGHEGTSSDPSDSEQSGAGGPRPSDHPRPARADHPLEEQS